MSEPDLPRTAYMVECLLNSLQLDDGPARTALERELVVWLAEPGHRDRRLIFRAQLVFGYEGPRSAFSRPVPAARQSRAVFCDGRTISTIDEQAYLDGGRLVMLGAAGLVLTMPGTAAAAAATGKRSALGLEVNSNNNNNNNNNNNG